MNEKLFRLMKLVEHWAEHNDEHAQRFCESAKSAKDMGYKEVAAELDKAHSEALIVSKHLRKALNEIEGSS